MDIDQAYEQEWIENMEGNGVELKMELLKNWQWSAEKRSFDEATMLSVSTNQG